MSDIVKFQENDVFSLGKVFAASGYFQDARDAAQATVKILAGRELGLPPFASMTGIHIIKGKPVMGANLIAARIKSSGKYTYRILEMSDQVCRIAFFEGSEQIGVSEFTLADARKAGTQNLDKFARNMLFARAISNGAKWFCPDLFITGVYVPEEIGARVDAEGDVIALPAPEPPRATEAPPAPALRRLDRVKAVARIEELGGDVEYASKLDDEALIAYGKRCASRVPFLHDTEAEQSPPAPQAPQDGVVVEGILAGDATVTEKVCKFSLVDEAGEKHSITVFPQRSCWHLVVGGNGKLAIDDNDVLKVSGKLQTSEKYGDSVIADSIEFVGTVDVE